MESNFKCRTTSVVSRILHDDPSQIFLLPADNAKELEEGENFLLTESELVRHSIILAPGEDHGDRKYRLDFEAEGGLQSLLHGDHPHTPIVTLSEILPKLYDLDTINGMKILELYQEEAFTVVPQCRPCDVDYIGSFSTKLVFINGIRPRTSLELYINEMGVYDDSANTSCLNLQKIESIITAPIDQSLESALGQNDFRAIEPLIVVGETTSSGQLIQSYIKGACYQYRISDLTLMIEDEDESLGREEWNRFCVDLLAQTDEAQAVLSAIEQIAQKASKARSC